MMQEPEWLSKKELLLVVLVVSFLGIWIMLPVVDAFNWNDGSIVSYWKLDETSGTIAGDVNNINNMTNNGATVNQAGKIGTSYYLDGSSAYLNKTAFNSVSMNTAGSISFWFNASLTQCVDNCRIIEFGNSSDRMGLLIDSFATDNLNYYGARASTTIWSNFTGVSIQDNLWHHYVATWNNTKISLWRDGLNVANKTLNASMNIGSSIPLIFGDYIALTGSYHSKGYLDEVGFWNRSLTAEESLELYASGSGLSYGSSPNNITILDYTNYSDVLELSNYNFSATVQDTTLALIVVPSFVYNGTQHTLGITNTSSGTNRTYSIIINIPYISQANITVNQSYYWSFNVTTPNSSSLIQNSTTDYAINHQMALMNISSCSGNYTLGFYNLTYKVEGNASNNLNMSNYWNYVLVNPDNTTRTRNASASSINYGLHHNWCAHYNDATHYFLVKSNNSEIETAYDSTIGYLERKDYVCDRANTTARNLSLYMLLNTTDYEKFYINIKDSTQADYPNAYVYFYKWEDNSWLYVGSELSDTYGNVVGRLVEDRLYKIIIKNSSCEIIKQLEITMTCSALPCTYDIILSDFSNPYSEVEELDDFNYSFSWDSTNEIVTLTYVDNASQVNSVDFVTYYRNINASGDVELCTNTSTESSDSLSCNVSAYDSGSFISYMYVHTSDGDTFVRTYTFEILSGKDIFGKDGLLWGILVIIALFFAGIWNPVVAVVFALMGVIMLGIIGIIALPWLLFILIGVIAVIVIIKLRS